MDETFSIVIRPYDPEIDKPMLYTGWRNGAYYGSAKQIAKHRFSDGKLNPNYIAPADYFPNKNKEINDILAKSRVRIACLKDSPNTIIGFSVSVKNHLEFVYVKTGFRNNGIAKVLVPNGIETYTAELTKIGKSIVEKKNLITKENLNGRIKEDPEDPKETSPGLH